MISKIHLTSLDHGFLIPYSLLGSTVCLDTRKSRRLGTFSFVYFCWVPNTELMHVLPREISSVI